MKACATTLRQAQGRPEQRRGTTGRRADPSDRRGKHKVDFLPVSPFSRDFVVCVFALLFCLRSSGQTHASSLGRISFPNSGSAAAQPPFVRGVLLLHSFEYDDAIEAFRQAQKTDSGFALAFWGEAMC